MKKLFVTALLSFVFILVCSGICHAADIGAYQQKDAQALLTVLDVMDADFKPESTEKLTRAEFVSMAVRLLNIHGETVDVDIPFTDVAINDPYYHDIAIAYTGGLVCGGGDNTFRPNDEVTMPEAAKILTTLIGYRQIAEVEGGYSVGYIMAGQRSGVLSGVDTGAEFVSGSAVIRMLYNTLLTDMYKQTTYGNGYITYEIQSGENLLHRSFDMKYDRGILNAVSYTSLTGTGTRHDDLIMIDGVCYKYGQGADYLLGRKVMYFYRDGVEETHELVYVYAPSSYNEELQIADEDFVKADRQTVYYLNEARKQVSKNIDSMADLIYNGMAYSLWTERDMQIKNGTLTLLDNDGDGDADVIFVIDYEDYVVQQYGAGSNRITLQFGKESIDLEDDRYIYRIVYNNTEIKASELKKWDVLSVARSHELDGKVLCSIYVSRSGFSGSIETVSDDYVSIDGVEYNYIETPNQLSVYVGLSGKFYVNILNKIIACDAADQYSYAYVRNIALKDQLYSVICVKLMTSEGSEMIYQLSENVLVDGLRGLKNDDILNRVSKDEIIRYRLNSKLEISHIDTVNDGKDSEDDILVCDGTWNNINYRASAYEFVKNAIILPSTDLFFVPDTGDEKDYYVGNASSLMDGQTYDIKVYGMNETKTAGCVVIYTSATHREPKYNGGIAIVTSVGSRLNSVDDEVVSLKLVREGIVIEDFWIDQGDTTLYSDIKKGDIIQYRESDREAGRIVSVRMLMHAGDSPEYFQNDDSIGANGKQLGIAYGQVVAVDSTSMLLNVSSSDSSVQDPCYIKSGVLFYIYDKEKNTVEIGSLSDVSVGDEVFVRENYFAVQEGVIIR